MQVEKNHEPFISQENLEEQQSVNEQLTRAISSKDPIEWKKFRTQRNGYNNKIKSQKSEFYKNQFSQNKYQWKFLQKFTNKAKQAPPNSITVSGTNYTSPKKIANLCNEYFIKKIEKIRKSFKDSTTNPIQI